MLGRGRLRCGSGAPQRDRTFGAGGLAAAAAAAGTRGKTLIDSCQQPPPRGRIPREQNHGRTRGRGQEPRRWGLPPGTEMLRRCMAHRVDNREGKDGNEGEGDLHLDCGGWSGDGRARGAQGKG